MTAVAATPYPGRHRRRGNRGAGLRRRIILLEILGAVLWCVVGFHLLVAPVRRFEVALAAWLVRSMGVDGISPVFGDAFLLYGPDNQPIVAVLSASCSALSSLLGLSALCFVVLRERPQALLGAGAALSWVVLANQARLVLSLVAGRYVNVDALIWFHDWVGAVLNFLYTLGGLLIMIALTMHIPERAEQDASGRHTARRPDAWARPGLGYRTELDGPPPAPRIRVVALLHRYVFPRRVSRWLGARRERGRVDYRVGHLPPAERAERVRALAGKGLGVHTATLVAVATYETDPAVLSALAGAVAARQWEPISNQQVAALRLWARAWLMRAPAEYEHERRLVAVSDAGSPAGVVVVSALRAAGDRVLALDTDPDAAGTRLADVAVVVPASDDPAYADAVLAAVAAHRPAAFVPGAPTDLPGLAERLAEAGCASWLPGPGAVDAARDEAARTAACKLAGVPTSVPDGRAFTADALVGRGGTLLTCVPHWTDPAGATTFDSSAVTEAVAAVLQAVEHTGPATVTGLVADAAAVADDPDAAVTVAVTGVAPGFSGGTGLTLAAGANVVSHYLAGVLEPDAPQGPLTFTAGTHVSWYSTGVYRAADGAPLSDPMTVTH